MKTITTVTWIHEADLIRANLESHGIDVFIPDEGAMMMQPYLSSATGGIRIQVDDAQAEEAMALIAEKKARDKAEKITCPECGSEEIQFIRMSKWLFAIGMLFLCVPFLWFNRMCRCSACNHAWRHNNPSSVLNDLPE